MGPECGPWGPPPMDAICGKPVDCGGGGPPLWGPRGPFGPPGGCGAPLSTTFVLGDFLSSIWLANKRSLFNCSAATCAASLCLPRYLLCWTNLVTTLSIRFVKYEVISAFSVSDRLWRSSSVMWGPELPAAAAAPLNTFILSWNSLCWRGVLAGCICGVCGVDGPVLLWLCCCG